MLQRLSLDQTYVEYVTEVTAEGRDTPHETVDKYNR